MPRPGPSVTEYRILPQIFRASPALSSSAMNIDQLHSLLRDVASGTLSPAAAIAGVQRLAQGLEDLRVDPGRLERTGVGEVIYGQGKPVDQIRMAMAELANHHPVLATRLSLEHGRELARTFPSGHLWEEAGLFCLGRNLEAADPKAPNSDLLIVTAGSTDLPVAREALGVARFLGLSASLVSDVGVAGLHRLMPHLGTLRQAKVLIAVAGMEGPCPASWAAWSRRRSLRSRPRPDMGPTSRGWPRSWPCSTPARRAWAWSTSTTALARPCWPRKSWMGMRKQALFRITNGSRAGTWPGQGSRQAPRP